MRFRSRRTRGRFSGTFLWCVLILAPLATACERRFTDSSGAPGQNNQGASGGSRAGGTGGTSNSFLPGGFEGFPPPDALPPPPDGAVISDAGVACFPFEERCDGIDNDCDDLVDEGFDLNTDPNNCGACGNVCGNLPQANPKCVAGACAVDTCLPGWVDVSDAPGCECLVSNEGVELCDGADNDCDGTIDEDFAFETDPLNCGACGNICRFANAGALCQAGQCERGACGAGYIDLNNDAADGCEYACEVSNAGTEICDGVDNDCDGLIDNDPVDAGGACDTTAPTDGECSPGVAACTSGRIVCLGAVFPGIEFCDGKDNDCDGFVDEGFDKQSDIRYCGNCSPCQITNAVPLCAGGICSIDVCSPGFTNLNALEADGCEYECTFRGIDVCNGLDDDCDGTVDDGIDKQSDVQNCGVCGNACRYANAQPICQAGTCAMGACNANFHDLENGAADGCEYFCVDTGAESCDGLDNNCDGAIDEGFDLTSNADHCGACGRACRFSNAQASCAASECVMGACSPGFLDLNQDSADGCEYQCTPTNGGVEICDGLDNDCDAEIDESDPQLGESCFPEGVTGCDVGNNSCAGACQLGSLGCNDGELICTGSQTPREEQCDDIDNDCDGLTDEDFDKTSDPRFCGSCSNSCSYANAVALCESGTCALGPCLTGWVDLNTNASDGCELACAPDGPEVCDGKDNDCDGLLDAADPDLLRPSTNFCRQVGACGEGPGGSDHFTENTFPICVTAAGASAPDWNCNYPDSVQLAGANEVIQQETLCDNVDNDCDGLTDEHVPDKGEACQDEDGVGACARTGLYACQADPSAPVVCEFSEPDPPLPTNEICDGIDNDCDGHTDESWDNPAVGSLTLCNGTPCLGVRDDVVYVSSGNFYMHQYEASRQDATATSSGTLALRACSRANVLPWVSVTYAQALAACQAGGMRLCAVGRDGAGGCGGSVVSDEWGAACVQNGSLSGCGSDPTFPYGCTFEPETCNGAAYPFEAESTVPTGSLSGCVTADLDATAAGTQPIFDLSGNVSEWTDDCRGTLDTLPVYTVRGGDFLSEFFSGAASALTCDFFNFQVAETYAHPSTGFRCCSDCPPGQADCSGVCVDLASSSAHCGACGSVCSGSCINGSCQ